MTRIQRAIARWRNASLRRRLLTWLMPAACVIGLVASAGTLGALRELDDLLDDQMRSMSKQIVVGPNGELSFSNHGNGKHGFEASDPDAVLLQVWRNGALVYSTDRDSKLPPPEQKGIASVDVDGQPWRTYVTERGGTTIRLAQARHARWEAIAGIAVHLQAGLLDAAAARDRLVRHRRGAAATAHDCIRPQTQECEQSGTGRRGRDAERSPPARRSNQ